MKTENCKLCKNTLESLRKAQDQRLLAEKAKNSTAEKFAYSCKQAETIIRHECYKNGIKSTKDFRARTQRTADLYLFFDGKRCRAEVKCGGTVGVPFGDNWTEDNILPGCKYIIFPVMMNDEDGEPIIYDDETLLDNSAVLSRDEFFAIAEQASRKGLHGTFHVTGKNTRTAIIAYQPTPLEKFRKMVYEGILNCEYMTVRTYIESMEG